MACSKAHGPQAFIRYVADKTGETITQQDWHDVRQMAREQGEDMSRSQVSAQEAIATLKALSARIKADEEASKAKKEEPKSADEIVQELLDESQGEWDKIRETFRANMAARKPRVTCWCSQSECVQDIDELASCGCPCHSNASVKRPSPTPAPKAAPQPKEAAAEKALMGAKVTRGTIAVMRFFATYGIKPVLAYVRAQREEQKKIKRAAKHVRKVRAAAGYYY